MSVHSFHRKQTDNNGASQTQHAPVEISFFAHSLFPVSLSLHCHFGFKLKFNNYGIIIIICKCPAAAIAGADTLITPTDITPLKDSAGVH